MKSRFASRMATAVAGLTLITAAATASAEDCGIFTGVATGCWNISSYTRDTDRIVGWHELPDGSLEYVTVENHTNVGSGTFSGDSEDFTEWWNDYIHGNTNQTSPTPEPETYALMLVGLVGLAVALRRRRNGQS